MGFILLNTAMKDFNIYSVEYSAGWGGTWFTWLINQHLGIDCSLRHDTVQQDFGFEEDTDNGRLHKLHWHYDRETFDEFVERSGHNSSFCYKLYPHHNWFIPRNRTMSPHYTKYRFMPYIKEVLAHEFILRRIIAINYNDNMRSTQQSPDYIDNPYMFTQFVAAEPLELIEKHSVNPIHSNLVPLDIGKILMGDQPEYNKLLEHIECEPLPNIELLCKQYIHQALHTENNPLDVSS
jgi:hypothetical protein